MGVRGVPATTLMPLVLAFALLSLGACASAQSVMIHEGPGGAVYLEDLRNVSLDAAHPTTLGLPTIERVLSGIRVEQDARMLQQLMPDKPEQVRAFSQSEVALLAPFVKEALTRATSAQVVRFEAVRQAPSGRETTGGTLYVKHRSIFLTLTRYRARPSKSHSAIKFDRVTQDATGLKDRKVLFVPKGILRTDAAPKPGLVGPVHLTTLVLDYQLLDKLAGLEPEATGSSDTDSSMESRGAGASSLEERMTQQEQEIEALKEELRSLQRDRSGRPPAGQQPAP